MAKKNEKRLCWNCDGSVSFHLTLCPYCGVDLSQAPRESNRPLFDQKNAFSSGLPPKNEIPKSPYANLFQSSDVTVSEEEWRHALQGKTEEAEGERERPSVSTEPHTMTFLLLLPGVFFLLFGLALVLFSSEGVLTLRWNQSFAYFYFFSAIPLLYLGWRALR